MSTHTEAHNVHEAADLIRNGATTVAIRTITPHAARNRRKSFAKVAATGFNGQYSDLGRATVRFDPTLDGWYVRITRWA